MRYEHWASILAEKIEQAEKEKFEWGKNDCCLFTADIVKAMNGIDYAKPFRNKYDNEKDAYALMRLAGYELISDVVDYFIGDSIDVKSAQRGDIVLGIFDKKQTLGICVGRKVAFKTPDGLLQIDTLKCDRAWRVI